VQTHISTAHSKMVALRQAVRDALKALLAEFLIETLFNTAEIG
jgi:hypothetical protein